MPRQFTTYQFDLFSSAHSGKTPAMPQWQTLSEGTPQALTALIVRLLVDPRQRRVQRLPVETSRNGSEGDRVRSVGSLQHFASIFSAVRNLFLPSQTNRSVAQIRTHRRQAMAALETVSARPA